MLQPGPAPQQAGLVDHAALDPVQAECGHPHRGEFDRERQAAERGTHRGDPFPFGLSRERAARGYGPLDEQGRRVPVRIEPGYRHHALERQRQADPASHQDRELRTRRHEPLSEHSDGVDQVLGVVEYQQRGPPAQRRDQRLDRPAAAG